MQLAERNNILVPFLMDGLSVKKIHGKHGLKHSMSSKVYLFVAPVCCSFDPAPIGSKG
jgi:hypothetical protein